MRREKIRRPRPAPLKRGPLVLLGDGVLLFLVLAGAVGSFCAGVGDAPLSDAGHKLDHGGVVIPHQIGLVPGHEAPEGGIPLKGVQLCER